MTSVILFFNFIPLIALLLLAINLLFAPHNPYQEKNSAFECGFHSFLGQNRTQFSISFFIFALLFLLFDLEILLVYPYVVSSYTNDIYGLIVMLIFFLVLTLGFTFELGKNALKIDSRQLFSVVKKELHFVNTTMQKKSDVSSLIGGLICILLVCHIKWVQDKSLENIKTMYIIWLNRIMFFIFKYLVYIANVFALLLILYQFNLIDLSPFMHAEVLYMDYNPFYDPREAEFLDINVSANSNPPSPGPASPSHGDTMQESTSEDTIMEDAPSETGSCQENSLGQVNNVLETYPEYKRVESLQGFYGIKQRILAGKSLLEAQMHFKVARTHEQQLTNLKELFARPNPHKSLDQLASEKWHIDDVSNLYKWALIKEKAQPARLADYNNRLQGLSILIAHLESQNKKS